MALNVIWLGFFFAAFLLAAVKLVFFGDTEVFTVIVKGTFDSAQTAFRICIDLAGILVLWLGIMKVGERGGAVELLARVVRPFFHRLFPELPKDHPVHGAMILNFAANILGLDNAATPVGLQAMQQLQTLNPDRERASNAQIMFLVLNTSGLTVIPVAIMGYRAQAHAANPTDVFMPILLTTYFSTLAGLVAVAIVQRINLFDRVVMLWIGGLTAAVVGLLVWLRSMPKEQVETVSALIGNVTLFTVVVAFLALAALRRVNVFEEFIDGAKEGFGVAIKIVPYLVAILVAIGVFRSSGAMDLVVSGARWVAQSVGGRAEFVEALPVALMKPLSGGGARGLMVDAMQTHGVDSFVGRLACTFQGATDTTFYIIAVYFGSVGIRNTRHAVPCGLIADGAAIVAGTAIGYLFFG
ncbi:MAG: nucleoside recognition domain-containing protein [Planctomycetota bacterium]